ncbi:hypothetical protein RFI_24443, partial [Reticulomyxa filosa]
HKLLWLEWSEASALRQLLSRCFSWEFSRTMLKHVLECYEQQCSVHVKEHQMHIRKNPMQCAFVTMLDDVAMHDLMAQPLLKTSWKMTFVQSVEYLVARKDEKTASSHPPNTQHSDTTIIHIDEYEDEIKDRHAKTLIQCYLEGAMRYLCEKVHIFELYSKSKNRKLDEHDQRLYTQLHQELQVM